MKIVFVFPYNTWGGAFRSTYVLSNKLIERGHDVEIVFPFFPLRNDANIFEIKFIKYFIWGICRSFLRFKKIPFNVKAQISYVPTICDAFMPDADVIVANHWNTVEYVFRLSEKKGRKFSYIRDVEQWADYYPSEVRAFKLPLTKIAVAKWIKSYLWDHEGINIDHVIANGTEWEKFSIDSKVYHDNPKILMCYATHPMKDMETGICVLDRVKRLYPNADIHLFGFPAPPKLNFQFTYHRKPTGDYLRWLYGMSDIFLWTSTQEGYGNPPCEAMSAQCAVVATNVGCITDLGRSGENMLVVSPKDIEGMVHAIGSLIKDPKYRERIGKKGLDTVKKNSWEDITDKFLEVIS